MKKHKIDKKITNSGRNKRKLLLMDLEMNENIERI